jgi:hypothetical protein
MSLLKIFCMFNYTSLFHSICPKGLYRHIHVWLCAILLYLIFTNKVKFSCWQPYSFSRIHKLFTDISRQCFFLFLPPHIGKVKQIQTHKGPSNKSVFLHKAPSVKSAPPSPVLFHFIKKMLLKNVISVISMAAFNVTCMFCFSILVSFDPQKCSLELYTSKKGWHTNLCCILGTWILFLFLCFWQNTHSAEFSYIA